MAGNFYIQSAIMSNGAVKTGLLPAACYYKQTFPLLKGPAYEQEKEKKGWNAQSNYVKWRYILKVLKCTYWNHHFQVKRKIALLELELGKAFVAAALNSGYKASFGNNRNSSVLYPCWRKAITLPPAALSQTCSFVLFFVWVQDSWENGFLCWSDECVHTILYWFRNHKVQPLW